MVLQPMLWSKLKKSILCLCLMMSFLWTPFSHGGIMTYTEQSAFLNQLNSYSIEDFDDPAITSSIIASGSTFNGITYRHALQDGAGGFLDMNISNQFDTTSGSQYLGVKDGLDEVFLDGDGFTMSFAPVMAIGLYVIGSPLDVYAGDLSLSTSGGTVINSGTPEWILNDGGEVYFLGIITDNSKSFFTSATLSTMGTGTFVYTVDDIIRSSPVPEPATIALFSFGIIGMLIARRTRKN